MEIITVQYLECPKCNRRMPLPKDEDYVVRDCPCDEDIIYTDNRDDLPKSRF